MKSLITCSCPAKCMFVIETAVMKNNCSILLPEKQWLSASTPVSILFLYVTVVGENVVNINADKNKDEGPFHLTSTSRVDELHKNFTPQKKR